MLAADRIIPERKIAPGPEFPHMVAAGFRLFRNSITAVCADGTVVPAGSANTPSPLVAIVGMATTQYDNTGAAGLVPDIDTAPGVWIRKGCWALPFDVAPTWANVNAPVYAVDDETVTLTENAGTEPAPANRLQVGTLAGLESDGTPYVLIP